MTAMLAQHYSYDPEYDTTSASLRSESVFLGIQPNDTGEFALIFGTINYTTLETARVFFTLDNDGLDSWIAELQRARSGCFRGQWPRPVPEPDVAIPASVDTVAGLVDWLEENFSASDKVGKLEVDITPEIDALFDALG